MDRDEELVDDSELCVKTSDDGLVYHVRDIPHPQAEIDQLQVEEVWQRVDATGGRLLGRGGFGQVFKEQCMHDIRSTKVGRFRAVKVIERGNEVTKAYYREELKALAKFSNPKYHSWFVKCLGWYEAMDRIFITMEYLEHGDLQRYLSRQFSELESHRITSQVVKGLGFMHRYNFIHRDLKPANLLVVDKPPEKDWWVKISDFGISKRSTDGQLEYSTVNIGTQEYMAPEVRFFKRRHKDDKAAYTVAADMWALGELCVRLITGNAAFDLRELVEYYHYQQAFVPDDVLASHGISQDGRDFIRAIMAPDPQHRLSAEDAAKHRWITLNHRPSPAMYGPVIPLAKPSSPSNSGLTDEYRATAQWDSGVFDVEQPTQNVTMRPAATVRQAFSPVTAMKSTETTPALTIHHSGNSRGNAPFPSRELPPEAKSPRIPPALLPAYNRGSAQTLIPQALATATQNPEKTPAATTQYSGKPRISDILHPREETRANGYSAAVDPVSLVSAQVARLQPETAQRPPEPWAVRDDVHPTRPANDDGSSDWKSKISSFFRSPGRDPTAIAPAPPSVFATVLNPRRPPPPPPSRATKPAYYTPPQAAPPTPREESPSNRFDPNRPAPLAPRIQPAAVATPPAAAAGPANPSNHSAGLRAPISYSQLSFITAQDQTKFEKLFKSAVGDGHFTMSGEQARDLLRRSRLDADTLSHIWTLADTRRSGQLYFPEFALAMYLCSLKLTGSSLPPALPVGLKNEVSAMIDIITSGIVEHLGQRQARFDKDIPSFLRREAETQQSLGPAAVGGAPGAYNMRSRGILGGFAGENKGTEPETEGEVKDTYPDERDRAEARAARRQKVWEARAQPKGVGFGYEWKASLEKSQEMEELKKPKEATMEDKLNEFLISGLGEEEKRALQEDLDRIRQNAIVVQPKPHTETRPARKARNIAEEAQAQRLREMQEIERRQRELFLNSGPQKGSRKARVTSEDVERKLWRDMVEEERQQELLRNSNPAEAQAQRLREAEEIALRQRELFLNSGPQKKKKKSQNSQPANSSTTALYQGNNVPVQSPAGHQANDSWDGRTRWIPRS